MSGGMPSGPSPAEGDHPACTTSMPNDLADFTKREGGKEGRGHRRRRPQRSGGLGLDGTGAARRRPQASFKTGPQVPTTNNKVSLWLAVSSARGIVTEWRRPC